MANHNCSQATRETLIELELSLLRPAVRSSAGRLDELLADDFVEVGADGKKFGKSRVLESLPSEADVVWTAADVKAQLLSPDVGLVTYFATKSAANERDVQRSARSSVWVRRDGNWTMVYHQGTRLG